MRTTIVLDDGLARRIKEIAHRRGISFRAAVDEVLRRGLSSQTPRGSRAKPYRATTFRSGFRPGVDLQRLNQLVDDLDVAERAVDR
ncbi:MAG: hypothetical protein IAG13_26330 [Deltaproteobacteria bacterium]|nr:hypothetical protein [Nannocystaceae bacterium]